ncbi:MAG TPA: mechanosensitive ion channel family protein [Pseudomonadales bacterium]|nr:mechanosensitive ion channel family protein [Pseudomonadales bacterium]
MNQFKLDLHTVTPFIQAAAMLLLGWVVAHLIARLSRSALASRVSLHHRVLAERLIFWGILTLFVVSALNELGFHLGVLLGAAGVLTVAVGFASQTSAANVISGLFVIGEGSIEVGNIIQVGDVTGEVLSIDWLSIKLRTFDNLFVRIPNETIIKSNVTNLSMYPIRRADIQIGIAYHEDIGHARNVLMRVADRNPLCLDQPEPLIIMRGFGDSSLNLQFSVWALRENFLAMRNALQEEIKLAFDAAGIEIPFPHLSLYVGEQTKPLPIDIVNRNG